MRRCGWLCGAVLVAMVGASAAEAAPCASGSLQSYVDLGAGGCSVGSLLFQGFTPEPGQSGATPISPLAVEVTPAATPGGATLALAFSSSAAAGVLVESFFRFQVSAPDLVSAGAALAGASATGDGVVTVVEDVCAGGSFVGDVPTGCSGNAAALIAFLTEGDSALDELASFAPAASLDVFADVAIDGGLAGSAALGVVTLGFAVVPEPTSAALVGFGIGLAALVCGRSRCARGADPGRSA